MLSITRIFGPRTSSDKEVRNPQPSPRTSPRKLCLDDDDCPAPTDATKRLIEAVGRRRRDSSSAEKQVRLDDARKAISDGAEVDILLNRKYPTLLYQVVMHGDTDLDMIRLLVASGADLQLSMIVGDDGFYWPAEGALSMALMQRQYQAARLLVELGADVNQENSFREFVCASDEDFDEEMVALAKTMFDAGGNCDYEFTDAIRANPCSSPRYLTYLENWWDDATPKLVDLLDQWMAERSELQFEHDTSPAIGPTKRQGRL